MGSTLAQLRSLVRAEIGDEEKIVGVATGGSLTEIIDSERLTQPDNYWRGHRVFVRATSDDLSPLGESSRIVSSSKSTTKLVVELPFSAAVEAGDVYAIAVFSDSRIDAAINSVLQMEMSAWLPERATEQLYVTSGSFRFSPASAQRIQWIDKIEYVDDASQERVDYGGMWRWNDFLKKVEWDFYWTENKTLTMHIARDHAKLSGDSDTVNLRAAEESFLIKLAAADLLLGMSQSEVRDDFGKLRPKSWTRGDRSETYDSVHEHFLKIREGIVEHIKSLLRSSSFGFAEPRRASRFVDVKADPDGRPAPQVFWELR